MQFRLFKITALFFLIFCGFSASANDILHNTSVKSANKGTFITQSVNKNPYSPFNYEFIINTPPIQSLNAQQFRLVHFSYSINTNPSTYILSVKYLNFICGRGNSQLSRFRKLILFPFHAFW